MCIAIGQSLESRGYNVRVLTVLHSVFQSYYKSNLLHEYSPSAISWIGSVQVFLLFFGGVFSGPLADRYGLRAVFVPSAILLVFAVMMTSMASQYYQFLLAHGVLSGLGCGLIFTPTVSSVGQYFTTKRAWAMGVVVSGTSVGGVVFAIVLDRLLNSSNLGFGWSLRIVGFIMLALLAFSAAVVKEHAPRRKKQLFLPDAFRSPAYIFTTLGFFFSLLGYWAPIFYVAEYSNVNGVSSQLAFYQVAIMNATSFFGRLIPNFVADRVGLFNANIVMSFWTCVIIFTWTAATSSSGITTWIAFYGFFQGALVSLITPCLAQGTFLSLVTSQINSTRSYPSDFCH